MSEIYNLSKHEEWLATNYISEEELERLQKPLKQLLYSVEFEIVAARNVSRTKLSNNYGLKTVIGGPQRSLDRVSYSVDEYDVRAIRGSANIPEFTKIRKVEFEGNTKISGGEYILAIIEGFYKRQPGMFGRPDPSAYNPTFYIPKNLGNIAKAFEIRKIDPNTGDYLTKPYQTEEYDDILKVIEEQKKPKKNRLDALFEDY